MKSKFDFEAFKAREDRQTDLDVLEVEVSLIKIHAAAQRYDEAAQTRPLHD
jgi:hypothetical protein